MPREEDSDQVEQDEPRVVGDKEIANHASSAKAVSANRKPRALGAIAKGGLQTGGHFTQVMSALLYDVIDGTVDHKKANAACNVANVMLKSAELELKRLRMAGGADRVPASNDQLRSQIFDLLAAQGIPMKPAVISGELGLPRSKVERLLEHEWFAKLPMGYMIAPGSLDDE
jgi:hypothetical protein